MKKIPFLILMALVVSCSNQTVIELPDQAKDLENLSIFSADSNPINNIELVIEQEFKDSDEVLIGNIMGFAIDNQGRLFIADDQQYLIHVFNVEGSFITSIGGEGQGPGEFQDFAFISVSSDQMYAYDYALRRISAYSLDTFELTGIISLDPADRSHIEELNGAFPTQFFALDDNKLLVRFAQVPSPDQIGEPTYYKYFLMNERGEFISDLIFENQGVEYLISTYGGGANLMTAPFNRHSIIAVSSKGSIYSAWTEDFVIKVFNNEGNYQRAYYYTYEKSVINRNEVLEHLLDPVHQDRPLPQMAEEAYRNTEFPETWPVLNNMFIDDEGRLWVSVITDSNDFYEWWVLDDRGQLLSKFNWPGNKLDRDLGNLEMIVVKDGFFYVRETDQTTGLHKIVKYKIEVT